MILGIDASRAITQQRTGTEAYARFLIEALIPLAVSRGHHIRLYSPHPIPTNLWPTTVATTAVSNTAVSITPVIIPFPRLWTHLRLAAELHRHPPDVFFTPAHVIPLSYFGPAVATIHDVGYHYFPEAHPARQLRYLRWSTRHNGRRAGRIVADSQATMADLVRLDGLDPAKIAVVDPGVDPTLHREEDAAHMTAVQQSYGITTSYFLYLSTIQPRKNLVRLIEAYAQSGVPHQLVLAGKIGWLAQPILDAIANLPTAVRQQIILPGFIPDADKAALLSGATALLYPSLYEGFGFPILEAQACGLPVLTANSSSCPEVAGGAALLVNPLDVADIIRGMQQLAEDAALRHRLAAAGLVNVRRFSWAQTAVQVLDLLELVTR